MANGFDYLPTSDTESGAASSAPSGTPGKRTLTDRLQRKTSGTPPTPAPSSSPVQRVEDNGLSCDQSFLDSILNGPVQRRADGGITSPDVQAHIQHATLDAARSDGPVQQAHDEHSGMDDDEILAAAAYGTSGQGSQLPHLDAIQRSFGDHDVSGVTAHVGGAAKEASQVMGAHGYATGDHVAFAESPSLFLAAHEAAHVVQQRGGVQLSSAVGRAGDVYERHADAVAARVVSGESAVDLLATYCGGGDAGGVQRAVVQRDESEIELAPSGGGKQGRGDQPLADPPPDSKLISKARKMHALAATAQPYVATAMAAIEGIKAVWDMLKPGGGFQGQVQLEPKVSEVNKKRFDRVLMHHVATAYWKELVEIGMDPEIGVDFRTWKHGKPPPPPEPAAPVADKPKPGGKAKSAPAKPHAEPSNPADDKGKPEVPAVADKLIAELQGLSIKNLQLKAEEELMRVVGASQTQMRFPSISWYWNGAGDHGYGPYSANLLDSKDENTYGLLTFYLNGAKLPDGARMGIPKDLAPLGLRPDEEPVHGLAWYMGGAVLIDTHEFIGDDLSIRLVGNTFTDGAHAPMGAYFLQFRFDWDNAETEMWCDLTYNPYGKGGIFLDNIHTDRGKDKEPSLWG